MKLPCLSYPNPWHHGYNGPAIFERHNVQAWESGRGMIVKVSDRQYDYLIDGRVVSQRGGCDMGLLERMIAEGLDKMIYGSEHKA
jgi:hypothetical protein